MYVSFGVTLGCFPRYNTLKEMIAALAGLSHEMQTKYLSRILSVEFPFGNNLDELRVRSAHPPIAFDRFLTSFYRF